MLHCVEHFKFTLGSWQSALRFCIFTLLSGNRGREDTPLSKRAKYALIGQLHRSDQAPLITERLEMRDFII